MFYSAKAWLFKTIPALPLPMPMYRLAILGVVVCIPLTNDGMVGSPLLAYIRYITSRWAIVFRCRQRRCIRFRWAALLQVAMLPLATYMAMVLSIVLKLVGRRG